MHYIISSLPKSHNLKFVFNWDVIINDHKYHQSWCGAVYRGLTLSICIIAMKLCFLNSGRFLSIFLCHIVRGTWLEDRIPDSDSGSGTMNNVTSGRLFKSHQVGKVGRKGDGERRCLG